MRCPLALFHRSASAFHYSAVPPPSMDSFLPLVPTPTPNPNPNIADADLPTTISLLNDLASLAENTLTSLSDLFSFPSSPEHDLFPSSDFCCCPYDLRHRMPPESLFHHSLRCPSAPGSVLLDLGFLDILRYPKSLKSEAELQKESRFVRPLVDNDDICFSLDEEFGVGGSNFFYRDCPGVVAFPELDGSSRTFTLPGILSVGCANFIGGRDDKGGILDRESLKVLPSELWALRIEVAAWRDLPSSYSYTVLRAVACLEGVGEGGLLRWIISNSPRYGILIDSAMRDHIFLLLKLCLKAIWREASRSVHLHSNREGSVDKSLSFQCPCLLGSFTWLASQLYILYGETNGKMFAIDMLKESLLQGGTSSLLFPFDGNRGKEESHMGNLDAAAGDEGPVLKVTGNCEPVEPPGSISRGQVFVSQVAAAVGALHERSLLETRIKALRFTRALPKYQLLNEYAYTSTRANEERGKRSNYRAILEHDGLLWQQSHNQDQNKPKTREELLAEERDYKRRRMSYRGKKIKRTITQVMHDIIDDHMEEIKLAGGIGCSAKGAVDDGIKHVGSNPESVIVLDCHGAQSSGHIRSDTNTRNSYSYRRPPYAVHTISSGISEDDYKKDMMSTSHDLEKTQAKPCYNRHGSLENHRRSGNKDERKTESRSGSPSSHRSHRKSHNRYADQDKGDEGLIWGMHKRHSSLRSDKYKEGKKELNLPTNRAKGLSEYNHLPESKVSSRRGRFEAYGSEPKVEDTFEDRYDPCSS